MTRHRQRGVAIITALLVVMLAAGIAAFLLAQQSRALTRAARATERAQAIQYAAPTLDWARAALFQLQKSTPRIDLTQPWARGLAAIPLDGAMAAGALRDEAGLFNINNLAKNGVRSEADIAVFRDLLTALKLNPDLADAAADWIDADDEPTGAGGAENSTYMAMQAPYRAANRNLMQIEELRRVRGFDDAILARLKPFISALPLRTPININTAPQEVLAATFPKLSTDDIAARGRKKYWRPRSRTCETTTGKTIREQSGNCGILEEIRNAAGERFARREQRVFFREYRHRQCRRTNPPIRPVATLAGHTRRGG